MNPKSSQPSELTQKGACRYLLGAEAATVVTNRFFWLAFGLVFLSGFAALVYQVLWMKQLGLLFGNTSHAASATLASFFAGLAMGSWFLGRRVAISPNPMRTYAWLECGIAVTALLYFVILGIYQMVYPTIYQAVGPGGWLLLIKFGLSLLLVFPPAFCMGGTIPVMGQFMVRKRKDFGKISALMYGVNTLGAATGAGLAGFYLPLWLGFNATCGLAIALSLAVAIAAFRLSLGPQPPAIELDDPVDSEPEIIEETPQSMTRQERRTLERQQKRDQKRPKNEQATEPESSPDAASPAGRKSILTLCFLSGFGVLALEVLWTRMFSQVLENSVYTFATILVVVLICLALGALASSFLARLKLPPLLVLTLLIIAGAGAVVVTPFVFMNLTNDMELITSRGSWSDYILLIFRTAALTIGPSALILGMIFPYLMKTEEAHLKSPGLSLGRLATVNTVGAIFGALLCGFFFLDALGMWGSMQLIAIIYLVVALLLPLGLSGRSLAAKTACVIVLLVSLIGLNPNSLPITSNDPSKPPETLIEAWEGSDCTVSVTKSRIGGTAIKINSDYSLGSTGAYMAEKFQADLPLMIYPETESLFFLGVGTGITAGGALDSRHKHVKQVVACELVPEVITASKKYMTDVRGLGLANDRGFDMTGGLFKDPRADVLVEDGRHYLMATDNSFDMINADLFVPFRSGAGSLYTKEHFESSKKRLTPDGVFVQWLPLYQLTENEFSIIAQTMIEVFDQVSMWRHNFQPGDDVVALIGHQQGQALPASLINSREDKLFAVSGKDHRDLMRLNLPLDPQTILFFYGGNLTAARELFETYPVNTDDRPVIEYQAPRSYRRKNATESPWFVGEAYADFVGKVQTLCPPESDPLLANRSVENRRLPLAGRAFYRARIEMLKDDTEATQKAWAEFVKEWTTGPESTTEAPQK
jgi:spermidine synthase